MDFLRALALGIVQALTEFLPISSSAHLLLLRDWIGLDSVDGLTFDVALHVGTFAGAVLAELWARRNARPDLHVGLGAVVGRVIGVTTKLAVALTIAILSATVVVAQLLGGS